MSAEVRPRRSGPSGGATSSEPRTAPAASEPTAPKTREKRPFLLDFFPLETADQTRLSAFFDHLRAGRLSTTRCRKDGELHWPPRTACPKCHAEELDWVDLPEQGTVYAFSAVLGGAPLGMEDEVPFAVGLVDLDGSPLRLFGRIEGRPWTDLRIGQRVRVEPYDVGDGRYFYRFRVVE
ncbi:MAG: Zn-ribbon domain-containing OB-fold protein [Thermoplasmata archaeon]